MYTGILKDVAIVGFSAGFCVLAAYRWREANEACNIDPLCEAKERDAENKKFQFAISAHCGFLLGSALFYGTGCYEAYKAGQYMKMLCVISATAAVSTAAGPYLIRAIHAKMKGDEHTCDPHPCDLGVILAAIGAATSATATLAVAHCVAAR